MNKLIHNNFIEKNKPNGRFSKIALSSATSVILKLVTFLSGFILTQLIIRHYGSEVNGMLGSILQFLAFITLLEGGVGGVARAALYKPLANKDETQIRKIVTYVEKFFRILASVFVIYAVAIAFVFPFFSDYDYLFTFSLVLILAVTTFCEYFFGLSYSILLASDQKQYITNTINFFITIINFVVCVILIKTGCSIHIVKLVSVFIIILKPIILSIYCKRRYKIKKIKLEKGENLLPEKWSGFGVHIAYYLHRNTDTFLITIFLSLTMVSVYSVYNLVISGILTMIESLSLGIESAFGNMYANKEYDNLKKKFKLYVFYYQFICTFLLSATFVLILPFVNIYTAGVTDANYYQPAFAALFVLSEFVYCLRVPYNDLMVATNSFKKIRWGAYIETIINIGVSMILVNFLGLSGVAIGTLCAMIFRVIHYLIFFKKHELNLDVGWFAKLTATSFSIFAINYLVPKLLNFGPGSTFVSWALYAVVVCIFDFTVCLIVYAFACNSQLKEFFKYLSGKLKRH